MMQFGNITGDNITGQKLAVTPVNGQATDLLTINNATMVLGGINSSNHLYGIMAQDICDGRLTLSSTDPCINSVTAATTLYWLPYTGFGYITLYNTTTGLFETYPVPTTGLSYSLSGLAANTNYDVTIYNNAGTLTLSLWIWANANARATALLNVGDYWYPTGAENFRYVGTIRTTGTIGQCEDSVVNRFVWNMYNQQERILLNYYNNGGVAWTWIISTGSNIRPSNTTATNCQVYWVNGAPSSQPMLTYHNSIYANINNISAIVYSGLSLNQVSGWGFNNNEFTQIDSLNGTPSTIVSPITRQASPLGYNWLTGLDYAYTGAGATATFTWNYEAIIGTIVG